MSEAALQVYEASLREQHNRNEARRIRSRVTEARRNPHPASVRWPFELLQNALDAGPRNGQSSVTVRLHCESSKVVFEHDGIPFSSAELAALLSGGSSKDFESDVTTGRFGTGFLVTHVLAERTSLRALLEVGNGYERFNLILDRSGGEDEILNNIHSCNAAIRDAMPLSRIDEVPSATFEYLIVDDNIVKLGLDALRQALPYLYATRPNLGRFELTMQDGTSEVWTAGDSIRDSIEDGSVVERLVSIERNGSALQDTRILRFTNGDGEPASLLCLERAENNNWRVRPPERNAPRVYREFPLRGSGFLPIEFVLDGKFEPDQERNRLLMDDGDKQLVLAALAASLLAVKYAFSQGWSKAHTLARVSDPGTAFDPTDHSERQWWQIHLAAFAKQLAALPIVECAEKPLPAISDDGPFADFIVPRLLVDSLEHETSVARMWPLIDEATELYPPKEELAPEWTLIADGWHGLGLRLNRVDVRRLAEYALGSAESLNQLRVRGNQKEWLARFLDVVGECWGEKTGADPAVLRGLLPNQNLRLYSPAELHRDGGVSEILKDISAEIGDDVRDHLLLTGFDEIAGSLGLRYLDAVITKAIPTSLSENQVIQEAINHLSATLPEDKDCDEDTLTAQKAGVRLASYLWSSQGISAAAFARQMPLMTTKGRAVRWSPDRLLMAPVRAWNEAARPFSNAYPPNRVLADIYAGTLDEGFPSSVPALVDWGIAILDPITSDTPAELKDRRLAAICVEDTNGVIVSGEKFSQIALLQPEVLNRCQEGRDEARALLGLVLCHVARNDPAWQTAREVKGRKAGELIDIHLRAGALWLADLKFRAWVPVPDGEGNTVKMLASASNLKDLLEPSWVEKNDVAVRLLSEWFGFDALELRLLGIAPDDTARQQLRNGLAKIVESAGADPQLYESLAADLAARQRRARDVARCRSVGLAVQDAVRAAMVRYGLNLKLVDRGFDYEVTFSSDVFDDASTKFEVGPYLLEVKATTTGGARLTPLQAETATRESAHYVLCVVDLRETAEQDLDSEWHATKVEALAKIVTDVGRGTEKTYVLVEAAKNNSIGIRNASALRYEVPPTVWESGSSIFQWVSAISDNLAKPVE